MDAMTPPEMLAPAMTASGGAIGPATAMQISPAQQMAAMQPDPTPTTHDVTIVTTRKLARARCLGVPPEEFGIERGARDIANCNYCFHEVVTKTESQLIAEGFDEDQVKELGSYLGNTEIETLSRDSVQEHSFIQGGETNSAARLVKITEHYIRMDYQGNGRACLYQVVTGGDKGVILKRDGKLSVTPFDSIPFAVTTPIPITHRFFGRSIADLVMPIQREKTAMKRGALDNLYLHNNPRIEVPEPAAGENTLDDLLTSRPGGIVRTKQAGMLQWQVVPDITGSVYPMMQYLDGELETKTGVSKQTQGLDANALQNQSATAVAQVFSSSQMRMKLTARIIAEGVKDLFSLLHGTIRKHGQKAETIKLRNKWVDVNPREWKNRNDMTINVGLGSGGKAQQFAGMMALANFQKELLLGGKTNLVDDDKLFATASELSKILGHKNADKFFNDPSEKDPKDPTGQTLLHPAPPPPPSPEEVKGKVQLQIAQQQSQLDQQADERKGQIETVQAQADIATQDRKTQAEMALAQQKFEFDKEMALTNAALEREKFLAEEARKDREHQQKMELAREQHKHAMAQSEMGLISTAVTHDAKMEQGAESHAQKMAAAESKEPTK